MDSIRTHQAVSSRLVGEPVSIENGRAVVELETTAEMRVDEYDLVHGGFVYGVADYAAMVAVNEPTVVLAGSEVRYPAPTRVGDRLRATAALNEADGRRRSVDCSVTVEDETVVLEGTFDCVVPPDHVLG